MYPVSSVMTSPGETMCFDSIPPEDAIFFLFLGNLASTDMFKLLQSYTCIWQMKLAAILQSGSFLMNTG